MMFDHNKPQINDEIVEDSAASAVPEMETLTDPVESSMEEEMLEEEHLLDDSEEEYQGDHKVDKKDTLPKRSKPIGEHTNSGNQLKSQTMDDSEDEQDTVPKYVYSWKELYNPKQPKSNAVTEKNLKKPNFVPHTCYVCNTSYEDADGMDNHLEEHVDMLPYKCETCSTDQTPQEFKTLIALNKHMQSHLYPYQCNFCPIRLLKTRTYQEHMRRHHDYQQQTDGFTCDYCGKHFLTKQLFQRHHKNHVSLEQGKYKCEYCGKVFINNGLLKRHRLTHTGEKPFECKKCGKKFNHRDNLKSHMRAHINEKGYVCTECGKSFINWTYLRYHMAQHFPDDPQYRPLAKKVANKSSKNFFECQFEGCDYATTTYSAYFYHKAMHELKFHCELCQKRFPTKANLRKHIASVHEGKQPEKTLACQYCDKLFNCKQKLGIHIDVHENNRRYKCQFCEKAFVQRSNCTQHERIHTGERPYPCRMCSVQFITSSGRTKHEKTHQKGRGGAQLQDMEAEYEYEELEEEVMEEGSAAAVSEMVGFDPL